MVPFTKYCSVEIVVLKIYLLLRSPDCKKYKFSWFLICQFSSMILNDRDTSATSRLALLASLHQKCLIALRVDQQKRDNSGNAHVLNMDVTFQTEEPQIKFYVKRSGIIAQNYHLLNVNLRYLFYVFHLFLFVLTPLCLLN